MNEREFVEYYCDDLAYEAAVNFYTDGFPVLYAGWLDCGKAIFYVTQADPNYEYECSIVTAREYGASYKDWYSKGDYRIDVNGANSFDEIVDILARWWSNLY